MIPTKVTSDAWFVQGGYSLWGAFDLLARYDSFKSAVGLGTEPERTQFLVFGFNVNPGFNAKFGMQYSVGLDGSLVGVSGDRPDQHQAGAGGQPVPPEPAAGVSSRKA